MAFVIHEEDDKEEDLVHFYTKNEEGELKIVAEYIIRDSQKLGYCISQYMFPGNNITKLSPVT
jgi:hypothetical protein